MWIVYLQRIWPNICADINIILLFIEIIRDYCATWFVICVYDPDVGREICMFCWDGKIWTVGAWHYILLRLVNLFEMWCELEDCTLVFTLWCDELGQGHGIYKAIHDKRVVNMLIYMTKDINSISCKTVHMMTSSNGNIFRVTGPLCGKFTVHRWIPLTNANDVVIWCFLSPVLE